MTLFFRTIALSGCIVLACTGAALAYDSSSKADRAELRARANAECRKPLYATDSQARINYAQGTFYCEFAVRRKKSGRRT